MMALLAACVGVSHSGGTGEDSSGGGSLAGTAWEVTAYNNGEQTLVSVPGGMRITANFGEDGRVTGSAGCNRYFASYEASDEIITIGMPGATRRLCAEPKGIMDQEAFYLAALKSAARFRLEGDRLELRTKEEALAVSLVRMPSGASVPDASATSASHVEFSRR
ncbi:MAG: META domain-containing protein [Pseudomonadota bacterium]